jgi:hypothetical protein
MFPQKWMNSDGKTIWMAWSGWPEYDNVSFIKATLSSKSPDLSPSPTPTPTPTPPPTTPPVPPVPMIPGRLEAEDYEVGGEGVGYHDGSHGNSGGEYRSDDVDIQVTTDAGGGYNVGWSDPGEWLAFDVEVAKTGNYDITARVASATPGAKTLHVELDGVDVTGPLTFTDASGWQSWRDVSILNIPLSAGPHELRLVLDTDFLNVNYLEVVPSTNQPPITAIPAQGTGLLFFQWRL